MSAAEFIPFKQLRALAGLAAELPSVFCLRRKRVNGSLDSSPLWNCRSGSPFPVAVGQRQWCLKEGLRERMERQRS